MLAWKMYDTRYPILDNLDCQNALIIGVLYFHFSLMFFFPLNDVPFPSLVRRSNFWY